MLSVPWFRKRSLDIFIITCIPYIGLVLMLPKLFRQIQMKFGCKLPVTLEEKIGHRSENALGL